MRARGRVVEKGKKAELCVLYLNGFVEKPARPLAAEGGGACRVWESRQRRHKHTDTGSLEPPEKRQTRVRIPGTTGGVLQDKEGACVCQLRALGRERCLRRGGNSHTLLRG